MNTIVVNEKEAKIIRDALLEKEVNSFDEQSDDFKNLLLKVNKFLKQDE